jgi:hypothetical protein
MNTDVSVRPELCMYVTKLCVVPQKWADTATENSWKDATAFNSVRPAKFVVVAI